MMMSVVNSYTIRVIMPKGPPIVTTFYNNGKEMIGDCPYCKRVGTARLIKTETTTGQSSHMSLWCPKCGVFTGLLMVISFVEDEYW